MADYYELLAVPRDADAGAIRAAYARQARERHPDRFTDPEEKRRAGGDRGVRTVRPRFAEAEKGLIMPREPGRA